MICKNLGVLVQRTGCCISTNKYKCNKYEITVTPNKDCDTKCVGFALDEDIMDKFQVELEQQSAIKFPLSNYGKGNGDGIVYVGGGKYWTMIVTGIRLLRKFGCTLPIEVWYRGSCERVEPGEVEGMGVDLIDSDVVGRKLSDNKIPLGIPGKGGWENKLYAIYHTRFDRVLFLDADAYCVTDPTELFKLLDIFHFVYWKDTEGQRGSIKWETVYPSGRKLNLTPVQGGQLLFDKIKLWKEIHIANWLCQNSHHYFKFMFGDQDAWRVAFAVTGYSVPPIANADWKCGVAFVCSFNNTPYIVHRCQGKMFLQEDIPVGKDKCTNPQYGLPREVEVFDTFAEVVNKRNRDSTNVFTDTYKKLIWGKGSGAGTNLKESQLYIDIVNKLIRVHDWKSVVDIGCGDGLVSSYLEVDYYTGYDCVKSMVDLCKTTYVGTHFLNGKKVEREYNCLDIYRDYGIINSGDVLFCKDVLHHWPTEWIVRWLDDLILSKKWKSLVLCSDYQQVHDKQDCHLGGYRALNPAMYPMNRYKFSYVARVHHKMLVVVECT